MDTSVYEELNSSIVINMYSFHEADTSDIANKKNIILGTDHP